MENKEALKLNNGLRSKTGKWEITHMYQLNEYGSNTLILITGNSNEHDLNLIMTHIQFQK